MVKRYNSSTFSVQLSTFALSLFSILLPGCADLPGVIREAAKDPAQVHIEVNTIYGRMVYDRNNPKPSP